MHRTSFVILFCSLFGAGPLVRADDPLQKTSEEFFPLPLDGTITLRHTDGSIHIYGWYEPRVRLVALRKAYTGERLEQIHVEKHAEPNALALRTVIPPTVGLFADRSGTIDYTLNVPETARLKVKLVNGEISLQGLRGAKVELELVSGRVFVLNSFAEIRSRVRNGALDAFFEWWENLPATFDFALTRGRIGIRLPAGANFRVEASAGHGRIHQEFHFAGAKEIGPGQVLKAATAPEAPVSLGLRIDDGNISLEMIR